MNVFKKYLEIVCVIYRKREEMEEQEMEVEEEKDKAEKWIKNFIKIIHLNYFLIWEMYSSNSSIYKRNHGLQASGKRISPACSDPLADPVKYLWRSGIQPTQYSCLRDSLHGGSQGGCSLVESQRVGVNWVTTQQAQDN